MIAEKREIPKHIGFLTAVGDYTHGVIGGLLVLDLVGRPLEYHCTEPFRPNRGAADVGAEAGAIHGRRIQFRDE